MESKMDLCRHAIQARRLLGGYDQFTLSSLMNVPLLMQCHHGPSLEGSSSVSEGVILISGSKVCQMTVGHKKMFSRMFQ
jgi:hypothetical protein